MEQFRMHVVFNFQEELITVARLFDVKEIEKLVGLFLDVMEETKHIIEKYLVLNPVTLTGYNEEMYEYIQERKRVTDQFVFTYSEFNMSNSTNIIYRLLFGHFSNIKPVTFDITAVGNPVKLYKLHKQIYGY